MPQLRMAHLARGRIDDNQRWRSVDVARGTTVTVTLDGYSIEWCTALRAIPGSVSS